MIRYGNLYKQICSYENLVLAHENAKKGKKHYQEIQNIELNRDSYLYEIKSQLENKTFKNSKYEIITRKTENGKIREIYKLPYFPDRIVHHAIMQVVRDIWDKTLIRDTYSAIKNRGIHDGVRRVKIGLRDVENTKYCLKLDVSKYYPSIDNKILKTVIRRKIKDKDLLWLLDVIIDSTEGVPIGNYLSQYFGNLYLSGFDHFVKEKLKCRYYYRYCDDIVILDKDKKKLHQIFRECEKYLNEKLNLKVKGNWQVFPVSTRGIDFLGYVFYHDKVLLRKSIKLRIVKKLNYIKKNHSKLKGFHIINSIMSYYGWLTHCDSTNFINKHFSEVSQIVSEKSKIEGLKNPLDGLLYV